MESQSYREILHEFALDNYGYVTTRDAIELEIPAGELAKLARRKKGELVNIGYGLYRDTSVPEEPLGYLAEAVLRAGKGAYLYGESVLAMHNLASVNPRYIRVASPHPTRSPLPDFIQLVRAGGKEKVTVYEGIPSQPVADAILECRKRVEPSRLKKAAKEARNQGLVTSLDWNKLQKELSLDEETQ